MWNSSWTKGLTDALEKTGEAISQAEKKASKGISEALERTGEAITHAATKAKHRDATDEEDLKEEAAADTTTGTVEKPANGQKVLQNIQMGWSSVVETTKRTVEATKEAVEHERTRIEHNFLRGKGFYKRDPQLPLDVEALRDAEVVYITDRIITMSHPAMASSVDPAITAQRKLAAIGHLLQRRHDGRFLLWNLSEVEYDISVLDDQVLTFSFPGSPSPPLGLLLKLLVSMENWMKADDRNVAVVHCLTGKGRTSTVLAAFLCWIGEAGFGDVHQALSYIAACKQMSIDELTIPSQRRYASYFKNMLDGVRPSQPPLLLKRIIMSEAPKLAKGPPRENLEIEQKDGDSSQVAEDKLMGCAPYLQVFKAGKLIFTSAATLHVQQAEEELPFVQVVDGIVPFNIEQAIQGDILIRCRHLTFKKERVSMFRAAFHTGYVPPNVLRLTKSQLDGACADKRYADDFFLDLIFEKVDAETATKHLESQDEEGVEGDYKKTSTEEGKGPVVKASSYDAMLQGDSRFWDIIAAKREELNKQKDQDAMWGPTVGRRRTTQKSKKEKEEEAKAAVDAAAKEKAGLATFSIGNEFDFLPVAEDTASDTAPQPAEKDTLMEALDAIDHDDVDTEEIVFNPTGPASEEAGAKEDAKVTVSADASEEHPPDTEAPDDTMSKESTPAPSRASSDDDLDDMDALLASTDEDLENMNLDDFDVDDDLDDLEAICEKPQSILMKTIGVFLVGFLAILLPFLLKRNALERLWVPAPTPIEYKCPSEIDSALNHHPGLFSKYAAVSERLTEDMTEFLATFRQTEFDDWGKPYTAIKEGMFHFKSTYYPPNLQSGSTIYESACGIGLNLYMTLEILQETSGIENLIVYGNEYFDASTKKANAVMDHIAPAGGRKGTICTADSTNLETVPSDAFDLVYTGYISPLVDPLKLDLGAVENRKRYIAMCESTENATLGKMAQQRQEDWYGQWVAEMSRIAKPGVPVIVEQVSLPYCSSNADWGGVAQDWWSATASNNTYGWNIIPESIAIEQDTIFGNRYHVFMRKRGTR